MRVPRAVTLLLSLTAALGTVLAMAAPAQAATGDRYVALGDSYSSGLGAGSYTSESGSCKRSTAAYPYLWAAAHAPAAFTFAACSGATTSTVASGQLSGLNSATTLVSVSAGGNDVGFSNIMTTCVLYGTSSCVAAVQAAENQAQGTLPGALDSLYNQIHSRAPSARVVVLNYPVFYQLGTSFCVGLSETSRAKIDEGINVLSGVLSAAAARHGFRFGDVRPPFVGHQLCSGSAWLHSLNLFNLSESYHPTAGGQSGGYLPVFTSVAG